MRVFTYIIRVFQRLNITLRHSIASRKILSVFCLTAVLLIAFISVYHDESYQITTDSLQSLNDKINSITSRIDSWNLYEQNQKAEYESTASSIQELETSITSSSTTTQISITSSSSLIKPSESVHEGEKETTEVDVVSQPYQKVKGVIMIFGRNNDLFKLQDTVRSIEERFNRAYQYDYLIVSDSVHSNNFKSGVSAMTSAKLTFHTVDKKLFLMPSDINKNFLKEQRKKLRTMGVTYTKAQRVKHTQRFWSKEIFNIEILKEYDYFMRVDPGSRMYCDIPFDMFKFMQENDKTLGFSFALKQDPQGFMTLWDNILKYIEGNPGDISKTPFVDFISDDKGLTFNGCQYRSSFLVGKLEFFRSSKYQKLAEYLDKFHGIYYETWDDSTFYTMGVSLLEGRDQIQFFNHLGYNDFNPAVKGPPHRACPIDRSIRLKTKCTCNPFDDVTWDDNSCIEHFFKVNNVDVPQGAELTRTMKAAVNAQKVKENEQKKYEEEQLEKERQAEREEKKKIQEEMRASMPELEQQEDSEKDEE